MGKKFQNPQYVGGIEAGISWRRTTLIKVRGSWQLVEFREPLRLIGLQVESGIEIPTGPREKRD